MKEMKSPGSAVLMDINNFDVVPFGRSKNMDHLLQAGISPLIELLANIKNPAKQNMMAYIVLRLQELRLSIPSPKILCLGDPLGIDSIILASCGFNVHHISFEQALMGKCAEFNFKMAMQYSDDELMLSTLKIPDAPYDAIVSLEHIQKSPDPQKFLKNISNNLSTGGLLFISESFDGIDDQRPANLYLNEKFASTLPILAAPFFKLEDVNTQPLGKPYLFSKSLNNLIGEDSYSFF
jgi:2-polyprenyl-3-methyl-5-hydroxy-6-metoxy-1,4-benzoquinol methylase